MANYPRLLNLDEETENALKMHLDTILLNSEAERSGYIDDLIKAQRDYWAKPATEKRKFPFTGAADIIIPLTAIVFETVHSRVMQQAFSLPQIAAGKPVNPEWADAADPFIRYFNHELVHSVKYKEKIEPAIIELEKLGTGVAYSYYENIVKYGVREVNGIEQEFPVTVKKGVTVCSVPLARWLYPHSAQDQECADWMGEQHSESPYTVEVMEQSGMFYPQVYEALKFYYAHNLEEGGMKYTAEQEKLENKQPTPFPNRIDWSEIWLSFNVDKNPEGKKKEIVVHYHRGARMLMAVRHNWYADLRRKYRSGVYFPLEHRINGIGIAKQNEAFQKEVTTQHRQRLDNATLANMRMIKVSKMSGYGPKEPVFPGKMWFLDDLDQIDTFQLGEIYPSAYNNEQQTLLYSQQRTGVNETILGMPQVGTPGTATSDLARIQEGTKKFDYVYGNIKAFNDKILVDIACDLQQFGPSDVSFFENIEGGRLAQQILTLPQQLIRDGLIIELASAGQKENKIQDRTDWQQIALTVKEYYTGLTQIAMGMQSPELMLIIGKKALGAITEAMKHYLETFDVRNGERIYIPEFLQFAISQSNASTGLPNSGGIGGIPQTNSAGAMADPTQILKLLGAGSAGAPA